MTNPILVKGFGTHPLAFLFANGEIGDYWRFNASHVTVAGGIITAAYGLINGLQLVNGAGATPTLATVGGIETADFGTADFLKRDLISAISQPGTFVTGVTGFSNDITGQVIVGSDIATRWQMSIDGSNRLVAYAGTQINTQRVSPRSTPQICVTVFNGASSKIRLNGLPMLTGNAGSNTTDFLSVGGYGDGSNPFIDNIIDFLFINRVLTASEMDIVERYFASVQQVTLPAGIWSPMYESAVPGTNSDGWNGFTWRQRIPASALADATSSGGLRLGFTAGTDEPLTISKAYIGPESGGSFLFGSAPTQLLWNGSGSVTIPIGQMLPSDPAALSINGASDTLVVSLYMNGGTGSDKFQITTTMNGITTQYKAATDNANTVGAISGYTAQNAANPVTKIFYA